MIALVGERGREVREFLDESLGADGLARSVVVVSTSDRPALERVRAAYAATAIAEGFRREGKRVLLLVDSVTRFARGLRELGLSAQEPPVRRGYPPSVFAELPRLFERAGNDAHGSITAFYTVLAEDDDNSDPVAEEVRSILDGHIVLSRQLAQAAHYPAIDVLGSASRVFTRVADAEHREAALAAAPVAGAPCGGRVPAARRRVPGRQRPAGRPRDRAHAGAEGAAAAALRRSRRDDAPRSRSCAMRCNEAAPRGPCRLPEPHEARQLCRLRGLRVQRSRELVARAQEQVELAAAGGAAAPAAGAAPARLDRRHCARTSSARWRRACRAGRRSRWPSRSAWTTSSSATSTSCTTTNRRSKQAQEKLQQARADLTRALAREDAVRDLAQQAERAHLLERDRRAERELDDQARPGRSTNAH